MQFYCQQFFTEKDIVLLTAVKVIVDALTVVGITCHKLCQLVQESVEELLIIRGHYVIVEHSWLLTPSGNIIDPYPPGVYPGPILVDGKNFHVRQIYRE